MTSVASVVDAAVTQLRQAGLPRDEARQDAVVLARGVLNWTLADWLSKSKTESPGTFQAAFNALVSRRGQREPVAHLLGEKEFYGRPFRVTRDTLIPRPETEGLVDAALAWLARADGRRAEGALHPTQHRAEGALHPTRIIDVGTGTGCVAITIALERRDPLGLIIAATDTSLDALAIARDNASRLGADTVEFRHGSLLADVAPPADLIVSNPPYVSTRDRDTLQPDVVRFEPPDALFGGDDGLDVIRLLIPEARRALAPGGALMMEIGAGQADRVSALLSANGFTAVEWRKDFQGIDRIIVAQQPNSL